VKPKSAEKNQLSNLKPILGFGSAPKPKNHIYKHAIDAIELLSVNFGPKCFIKSVPALPPP
jgi:hypothetical protein